MCADSKKRVVVTGMGVVNALGLDLELFWEKMLEGNGGFKEITHLDLEGFKTKYGALVDDEALSAALKELGIKPLDRAVDMALVASAAALKQAGLFNDSGERDLLSCGAVFGSAVGACHSLHTSYKALIEKGLKGVRPTTVPRCMANVISSHVSLKYGLAGPNYVMVSACASSTLAVGNGFRMIRDGYIDKVLCGGADAIFEPGSYAGWNNLGVMSRNPDKDRACRPFDADRDGCVLGEGAGAIILESLESATARGAEILGEVCGYGESSDCSHITTPSAEGQSKAISMALSDAGISPEDIGFINAHGTATRANDSCESKSVRMALGDAADSIPAASNKSHFGHMMGASGVMETITTVKGLKEGRMPPNRNLDNQDPECDMNLAPTDAPLPLEKRVAVKNSFGFGGNNGVLVLKAFE